MCKKGAAAVRVDCVVESTEVESTPPRADPVLKVGKEVPGVFGFYILAKKRVGAGSHPQSASASSQEAERTGDHSEYTVHRHRAALAAERVPPPGAAHLATYTKLLLCSASLPLRPRPGEHNIFIFFRKALFERFRKERQGPCRLRASPPRRRPRPRRKAAPGAGEIGRAHV